MLRARLPIAVALLAATILAPTAAFAVGETDPTGVQQQVTEATAQGSSNSSSDTSSTDSSSSSDTSTNETESTEGGTGTPIDEITEDDEASAAANPFEGTPLEGVGAVITDPTTLPTELQSLGTCLQGAGTDAGDGQACFETFFEALGLPASCFSSNDFTLEFVQGKLEEFLSGNSQPSQEDLEEFATNVQGLLECLTSMSPSATPSSEAPVAEETTPEPVATGSEAPAAIAVVGTPDFTG